MAGQEGSFVCQSCGKQCKSLSGLSNHMNNACKGHAKRVAAVLGEYQEHNKIKEPKRARFLPPMSDELSTASTSRPLPPLAGSVQFPANTSATAHSRDTQVENKSSEPVAEAEVVQEVEEQTQDDHLPRTSGRVRKPNARYLKDYVDSREEYGNIDLLDVPVVETDIPSAPVDQLSSPLVQSIPDTFGLRRLYYEQPSHIPHLDPTRFNTPNNDAHLPQEASSGNTSSENISHGNSGSTLGPYKNVSELLLTDWFSRHPRNTLQSFSELRELLDNPSFNVKELSSAGAMFGRLSSLGELGKEDILPDWLSGDEGWQKSAITIEVPFQFDKRKRMLSADSYAQFENHGIYDGFRREVVRGGPQEFSVHNFFHRSLTGIIRRRLQSREFQQLHVHPYELRWQPLEDKPQVRVYGETYASSEFLKAHLEVQKAEPMPHKYPRCVLGMIIYSDGTKLSTFGDAQLWPGYLQFANDTKYLRAMPSAKLTEHFAYFEKLPSSIKSFLRQFNDGKKSISALLTHCKRELFHAQWRLVLDDDFLEAYENGILVKCYDGLYRLFFPRIFIYSADYPEKVLLASIKYLTTYPCPSCLVRLEDIHELGTAADMSVRAEIRTDDKERRRQVAAAQKMVYEEGVSLQSQKLKPFLDNGSYTINQNAFSDRLSRFGFNYFSMFRTEMLHEWSSNGEGKKVHLHLLRILDTTPALLSILDDRYREIPSFGKDNIRKFRANVSEVSFQAARDIEDIIQCALPAYEELLPEPHNSLILNLLYCMADWHALAKLRLHTDYTLHLLDSATIQLGAAVREFLKKVCSQFKTFELKHEAAKRARRYQRTKQIEAQNKETTSSSDSKSAHQNDAGKGSKDMESESECSDPHNPHEAELNHIAKSGHDKLERLETSVNLNSSKFHALGDVARNIREVGTTDSYTAEIGESEHRVGKRRYLRTNGRDYTKQLAQLDRREARVRQIRERFQLESEQSDTSTHDCLIEDNRLDAHHQIGISQNDSIRLVEFTLKNRGDPAAKDFLPRLKKHLLYRLKTSLVQELQEIDSPSHVKDVLERSASPSEHLNVVFKTSETMYRHSVFRVNFTVYDVRRQQDVLNPNTEHKDLMVLSHNDEGPRFYYARLIGIYHCNVRYSGLDTAYSDFRRMEFLWVRWFRTVEQLPRRLECVEFVPFSEDNAVGFLDPSEVVRAVHIIPRFSKGLANLDRKGRSRACHDGSDYRQYYVARFSNHDLYMRGHWGLGVGHKYSHQDAPSELPPTPSCSKSLVPEMLVDDSEESQSEGKALNQSAILGLQHNCEEDSEDDSSELDFEAHNESPDNYEDSGEFEESDGYASEDLDDQTYYAKYGPAN